MQQVTVGTKYQIVIPKEVRNLLKGFRPGRMVSVKSIDKNTATITTSPDSWVEKNKGLMTKAWKGINIEKELERMRSEW